MLSLASVNFTTGQNFGEGQRCRSTSPARVFHSRPEPAEEILKAREFQVLETKRLLLAIIRVIGRDKDNDQERASERGLIDTEWECSHQHNRSYRKDLHAFIYQFDQLVSPDETPSIISDSPFPSTEDSATMDLPETYSHPAAAANRSHPH
jgi:hypothetical protein